MALPPGYTLEGASTQPQSGGLPPGYSLEQQPAQQTQPGVMAHLGAVISGMNPFPGLAQTVMHPVDAVTSQLNRMGELRGQAVQDFKKGNYNDALYHGLGGITPGIGPMASDFIDGIDPKGNSMDQAKQLGGLLMPAAMKAVPPIARVVGSGLKKTAVPVMESGLGVSAIQRGYGKTPGLAALEETNGIRPATVAASARAKMGLLNDALEQDAANSPNTGSLQPAINVGQTRMDTALAGNSSSAEGDIQPMIDQLTVPGRKFAGTVAPANQPAPGTAGPSGPVQIAPDQSALQLLKQKREFGQDHTKWNLQHPNRDMATARQMYHALDLEFDKAVPGAAEKNQLISSLIPVAEDSDKKALNAGFTQNVLHRGSAKIGALAAAVGGAAMGGPVGAAAGLLLPEAAALPATRIAAARALYGAGRGFGSTAAQRAAQAALLSGGLLMNGQRQRKGLLDQ